MKIRNSTEQDFPRMMQIYAYARQFMAEHGNPNQWGPTNWPPEALIHQDIRDGSSYVCVNDAGKVIGTFYFIYGKDIEPTYRQITDGAWFDDSPYGVVHRLAGDGSEKGIGAFCLNWALSRCGHLRIDTHGDNKVLQNLAEKLGFTHCGTIYVVEDHYPRLAYEKTLPRDISSRNIYDNGGDDGHDSSNDESCYLTIACIRAKALPDDCDELQTLRYFRDGWLKKQEEGPALIKEYDEIAPKIVQAVDQREDAAAVWNQLYEELVLPCVWLIHVGQMQDALFLYKTWSLKLKEQYL